MLIVITPSFRESLPDGSAHWAEREIAAFLEEGSSIERVIVVLGPGANPNDIPRSLIKLSPNWDWVDLRNFRYRLSFDSHRDDALEKIFAQLYRLPDDKIPLLRQEQARRRRTSVRQLVVAVSAVFCVLSLTAIWALMEQSIAQHNATEARSAEHEALRQRDVARMQESQANSIRNNLIANTAADLHAVGDYEAELKAFRVTEPDFQPTSVHPYSSNQGGVFTGQMRRATSSNDGITIDARLFASVFFTGSVAVSLSRRIVGRARRMILVE